MKKWVIPLEESLWCQAFLERTYMTSFPSTVPIFGINEVPSITVIIGGTIITLAVLYYGYKSRESEIGLKS